MDAKMKAIISHLFGIGWIIALILNMNNKEEYASYYIRQNLGIIIIGFGYPLSLDTAQGIIKSSSSSHNISLTVYSIYDK